jgi:hypothetical protein
MQLLQEIQARPDVVALAPDTQAMANLLSQGRKKNVQTLGGIGTIMKAIGPEAGGALLDTLESLSATNSAVKWAMVMIKSGTLDFGDITTQGMIDQLVADPAMRNALKAVAKADDPVSEYDVRVAIYNDDGSLKI